MKHTSKRVFAPALLSLLLAATLGAPAHAATFNVPNGNVAALKAAINASNSNGQNDIINLAANGSYTLSSGADQLSALTGSTLGASGLPYIEGDGDHALVINGHGATISRSNASGTPAFRLLTLDGSQTTLNALILRNGNGNGNGNDYGGGAVFSFGSTLTVRNSTLSGNSARDGGAITSNSGSLIVENCTVFGNSATQFGGGILAAFGDFSLINSTLSGNRAGAYGGGFASIEAQSVVESCTVTQNRAPAEHGGGIASGAFDSPDTLVSNSIVAGNSGLDGSAGSDLDTIDFPNVYNSFQSGGYNLIGITSASFNQPGDQVGVTDPKLGPLANNGGPTPTHALLPGSRALDKGNTPLTTDQRGLPRPFNNPAIPPATGGDNSDIGAFEQQGAAPVLRAPTNLRAVLVGNSIQLTWMDNSQGELGYKVERKVTTPYGSFPYVTIFRGTTPNQTTFTDSNILPGATYTYRVRAYATGLNGPYSNETFVVFSSRTPATAAQFQSRFGR